MSTLVNLYPPNLRGHHQGQVTRIVNPGWVILSTPQDGLLRPAEILRHRQFNRVYCPLVKLLITLTQTSSEDMILPAI